MIDVESMIRALRLAWISRLLALGRKNWKTGPDCYLGRCGSFELSFKTYNYRTKYIDGFHSFYDRHFKILSLN